MTTINSFQDLIKLKESAISEKLKQKGVNEGIVQVKVGMATCGIASGAKEIMKFITEECEQQAIDVNVMQTGCIGYCYAEPIIEIQLPNREPKFFGFVDQSKAREIIEKYIIQGEDVEGELPVSYRTIN